MEELGHEARKHAADGNEDGPEHGDDLLSNLGVLVCFRGLRADFSGNPQKAKRIPGACVCRETQAPEILILNNIWMKSDKKCLNKPIRP